MDRIYISETDKIRDRVIKYCKGKIVLDIGCAHDKITKEAQGIDMRRLEGVNHVTERLDSITDLLPSLVGGVDTVYSSHCLEHFRDDIAAMNDWVKMLKAGGYLVLYLPCDTKYPNHLNKEHLHIYTRETFKKKMAMFVEAGLLKIEEEFDDYGHDRYSFCVVFKRSRKGFKKANNDNM